MIQSEDWVSGDKAGWVWKTCTASIKEEKKEKAERRRS